MVNFCEEFEWVKRDLDEDGRVAWTSCGVIMGAFRGGRQVETGLGGAQNLGGGQVAGVQERGELYIPAKGENKLPAYDDFMRRMRTGMLYRVMSDPKARKAPDVAGMGMYVCDVITTPSASLPPLHGGELVRCKHGE